MVRKSIFRGIVVLVTTLALCGCTVSVNEYRKMVRYDAAPAAEPLNAAVRLEVTHTLAPEIVAQWKQWMNPDESIENYRQAIVEAVTADMTRSGFLPKITASDYDFIVRIETRESKPANYRFKATLSVIPAGAKEAVTQYTREADLGDSSLNQMKEMKSNLRSILAEMRTNLLADYKGGKIKALASKGAAGRETAMFTAEAEAARKAGNPKAALAALRGALRSDPRNPALYREAADLLLSLCDADGAIRTAEQGLRLADQDQGLRDVVGRALKLKTADAATATAEGLEPQACRAQAANREGVALARGQQRTAALAKFEEAAAAAPGLIPKADYNAALILEQTGKSKEALQRYLAAKDAFLMPADEQEALQKVIVLAQRTGMAVPESAERRYRVGILRAQQKRYPEAVKELEAALAEAPWLVDAYYNLGLVYDFSERYADALHTLKTYLLLAPNAPQTGSVKTKIVELEDRLGLLEAPAAAPERPPQSGTL